MTLYELASPHPGWISTLSNVLSVNEIRLIQWAADFDDAQEEKSKSVRREYDIASEIPALSEEIASLEQEYEAMTRKDRPYIEKALFLIANEYEKKLKLRDRMLARLRHEVNKASMDVTDEEIERARNVPLEDLVEVPRTRMVQCPFHPDKKPSFWIKNGFGYCMACHEWADSIKYLMKVKGIGFLDAVRALR